MRHKFHQIINLRLTLVVPSIYLRFLFRHWKVFSSVRLWPTSRVLFAVTRGISNVSNIFLFRKNEKLIIPNDFAPIGERVLNCIVLKQDELTGSALMQFYGEFDSTKALGKREGDEKITGLMFF